MTKRYSYPTCLSLITLFLACLFSHNVMAQPAGVTISGKVTESGSGLPLKQVFISVSQTGVSSETDEKGEFSISAPDLQAEIIFNLPGYALRNIFLNGRNYIEVSLVSGIYRSFDDSYNTPIGPVTVKDAAFPVTSLNADELKFTRTTSFDQTFQGRVPGMKVTRQSGMPGQRTFMNIRGISSLYGQSEPLLFIDGMIHDYAYANVSLMEGFALNPMDVVDLDDISDISVLKEGLSYLGAAGSNGAININTEQKGEASTVIKFSTYGGIALTPPKQNLMDAGQFKGYFSDILASQGFTSAQIGAKYPWLNGTQAVAEYYRYNNNTDWQDEIYDPAVISKHHFFIKGGDDIATYNISTGYLSHQGIYENSNYSRFNLRINGKINISNKFSVTPNAKLSLADTRIANHGPAEWKNPVMAAILMPPLMAPYARDPQTGAFLNYLDDVGAFNVSNPKAIVQNALGTNRNYHFLSSVTAQYKFNENLSVSTMVGINFNNARENIFLPDIGIVQVDSAYNSPGDFIYEFRSTQNHTNITYTKKTPGGHSLTASGGLRYMVNSYKHNKSLDLNTPSDDFKRLGQGSQYSYLRTTTGDNRGLSWISYYGNMNYGYRDRYFLSANLSYDGNSATNENNRYHVYPTLGAAWRLSSESFLNKATWLEDLKIRGSYSLTGNMFSSVYDYSKLYYTSRRMNATGVLLREIIPNENLELEMKKTINAGIDLSVFDQQLNIHADIYKSNVDNLIIKQTLPVTFGYTDYFDNGGKLETSGVEISADTRLQAGKFVWRFGGSLSKETSTVTSLKFLDANTQSIITTVEGAEYITSQGNALNAFYGYKTNGIVTTTDAGKVTGPKGIALQAGDVKFADQDNNNLINDKDKTIIGDPNPDFFGSAFTGISIGQFEINAMFSFSVGNDVFNYVRYRAEAMDAYNNQRTSVLDRWTTAKPSTTLPRAIYGDPAGNHVFSDRWIEDGSYLRLSQLTLNYNLPAVPGWHKGIVVYATATNLLTVSNYSGYDPEFVYLNSPLYMGIDYGKMPLTKSFILGLKLDL